MPFTQLFAFIYAKRIIALVQAKSKSEARIRAALVPLPQLQKIHRHCKIKAIKDGSILRAPVFFDGHFRAIEDGWLEEDVLAHHRMAPYQRA
jgi:hypothetical protein